ncbi:MAG TPA: valine--tRNA ligase [Verrucomicrobiota bacterium]|nr:valine--tRNA ligase [Verrucomicrobiota bacterium]HNT14709.1 valine--tRNA ligase [Verrucomicrobiota bacterium]
MSEIPKAYEPQSVEDKWYDFWLKQGCFTADPARVTDKRPAYSIVIPPPNVTGMLHMGHVLNNTIQDILARKARMDGKEVLWLPGTDHAGIATQVQVEKALKKEEKKSKHDLGRDEFLKRVWQWKEKHGGIIINQLKKLGCSCDWTRERFTMDAEYSRCVQKVFVELYKKGLIYRGKRMVNWCPATQTALSDEEVEMKPQKGFMYHFRVEAVDQDGSPVQIVARPLTPAEGQRVADRPGEGKSGGPQIDAEERTWLTIATTRPETIPGDTAVAVNPKDPRYAHLIGKHIVRPLPAELPREQKLIPIIGDEHVDFEFGTGVLKVTPAHDKADFEIGQRHKLRVVDIMNPDGSMNELAGADLKGLDRFKARKVAEEKLTELGALVETKSYENNVGFSQRADVPIEPRLSEQWFLKYPAVEEARACVEQEGSAEHPLGSGAESGTGRAGARRSKMRFHPQRWAKVYDHWLTNIQDWCISRQLWWGHRIPVWYRANPGPYDLRKSSQENLDANYTIETVCQIEKPEGDGWEQDPDVLDTWFSSWLWPFATMGWPEQTDTLKKFYPTTDLVTGPDIIFFWVARMIMAGYEYMGELPFKNVYFTGIIRDKQGRKMSKTLGNSPDPLELIAKYGADALRFGTMRSAPLGQDVLFDEKDVELGRNFCNKLWNACRFRQMQGGEVQGEIDPALLTTDDKWILLKLNRAIEEISTALNTYNFSTAVQTLYRFFWNEYCDWYVEASKAVLGSTERGVRSAEQERRRANTLAVVDFVLSHTLRLFHPFLPFITEELWHGMGYAADMPEEQGGRTLMTAPWPKPFDADFHEAYGLDETHLEFASQKYEVVTLGRNLRRVGNIQSGKKVKFVLKPSREIAAHDGEVIKLLLNAEALDFAEDYVTKKGTPTVHTPFGELFLPLDGLIDVAAERARLTKEKEKIEGEIVKVEQKLANPNFTQRVPAAVLREHEQRLTDWKEKFAHVSGALDALGT